MIQSLLHAGRETFKSSSSRELCIDEREFGEIEALPALMAGWCEEQFAKIAHFAEPHEAPDDGGWTGIYVRQRAPRGMESLAIPMEAARKTITRHLTPFAEVLCGGFARARPVYGAYAFGPSPQAAIVLNGREGSPDVATIALVLRQGGAEAAQVLSALAALPSPEPLIVVDWQQLKIVKVAAGLQG